MMIQKKRNAHALVATIISRIFDPVWIIPLMLSMAVAWSLVNGLRWRFLFLLIFIDGIIPFLYFIHLLRTKEITDWDTTSRRQRYELYGFTVVVHFVGVLLAFLLGKIILAKILFSFWMLAVVFFAITLFWKISVHAGVYASAIAFVSFVFGWQWMVLEVFLVLIGWARITLKKHTPAQFIAGALVAPALVLVMLSVLGVTRLDAQEPSQAHILPW